MKPDYCPMANEPCQSMCNEPCSAHRLKVEKDEGELHRLQAENEALRKDAERLNSLESLGYAYGFQDLHEGNCWSIEGPYASVREALDAQIEATKKGGAA